MPGMFLFGRTAATLCLIAMACIWADSGHRAIAKPMTCTADVYAAIRAPATKQDASVNVDCNVTLDAKDVITKQIVFSGAQASKTTLDCGGATLDGSRGTVNAGKPTVLISSIKDGNGGWSVPSGISVRNCTIKGALRLQGLGANGQAKDVQTSSLTPDHTAHAQASAPAKITLSGLTFVANGGVPLYLGPGVTGVRLEKSTLSGQSNGPALYLDAESAGNTVSGNRFAVKSKREQIAIDGSAGNTITGNLFDDPASGGVFLYRNCGEGGTIRHQKPQHNQISGNTFKYTMAFLAKPAVWMNSRGGTQRYCFRDPAHPFGSSLSSQDFAQFNTVTGNHLMGGGSSLIRNSDPSNVVKDNGS